MYEDLAPYEPADLLPADPLHTLTVRHTVGLGDPLTEGDVTTDRPDDLLPLTLEEYVREDGVNHFKIRLSTDEERDAGRLAQISCLLSDLGVKDYWCTVDANEGYNSASDFRHQWEAHASDPALANLFDSLA